MSTTAGYLLIFLCGSALAMNVSNTAQQQAHPQQKEKKFIMHSYDQTIPSRDWTYKKIVFEPVINENPVYIWHQCDVCGKKVRNLEKHCRLHQERKQYICMYPGCPASFTSPGRLTIHTRLHTKEIPFACPHEGCTATFNQSNNYQNHLSFCKYPLLKHVNNLADTSRCKRSKKVHQMPLTGSVPDKNNESLTLVSEGIPSVSADDPSAVPPNEGTGHLSEAVLLQELSQWLSSDTTKEHR